MNHTTPSNTTTTTTPAHLLSLYGLKWNPFTQGVPVEGLYCSPRLDAFGRRSEMYLRDGGFAMITGAPGLGKSWALRILDARLSRMRDVVVRSIEHPQSGISDFYRQLGDLFGVSLTPRNRWGGFKAIREKWQAHVEATLIRPVLIIDEAQEMHEVVLNEMRLLSSRDYDSKTLLYVVLAGDGRLREKLKGESLLPLKSRIRTQIELEPANPAELSDVLRHIIAAAGNAQLMTPTVITALAEHAGGNYRTLTGMAHELLIAAAERDARQIDEKLFFEIFALPQEQAPAQKTKRR
jgi:type II secretory pathway predicted ATPase ExeA